MNSRILEFIAYGHPAPQGSKERGASGQLLEASRFLGAYPRRMSGKMIIGGSGWRRELFLAIMRARIERDWQTTDAPCAVSMLFAVERAAEPVPHARLYPAVPPDLDKLVRAVNDALTRAGVWRDDALCVETPYQAKFYADSDEPEPNRSPGGEFYRGREPLVEFGPFALPRPGVWCRIKKLT